MSELTDFLNKLGNCDLIVLTLVSADRIYCRFLLEGQYMDRLYVSESLLIAELKSLCGQGEAIDASGIAKLKQTYLAV